MSKILDIKFYLKTYEYEKPFHITGSIATTSTVVEVELITESGAKGYGEASPSFRVNGEKPEMIISLENFVKDSLIGYEIKEYRKLFEITDKLFGVPSLKAAIQFSILDALCEEIGIKVHEFFGGMKEKIETDKTVGIDSLENRIADAKKIYEEGFRTIKVKVGENLKEDILAMIAISNECSEAKFIVDANMGYTPKEAIQFAAEMYRNGINIFVYEQPVPRYDIDGLKYVRMNSLYPVGADESARTKEDVLRLIKEDAVDYINIKLMKSGLSDALAIIELAKSANKKLMIGCMGESSLGINQSVQFALGTGAFEYHDLDSSLLLKEEKFRGKYRVELPYYYAE